MLLLFSYLSDLIFGDPENFPHPIRGIGKIIVFFEKNLRRKDVKRLEKIQGVFLAIIVVGISSLITSLVLSFSKKISPFLGILVWIYLGYVSISVKDLRIKAMNVYRGIKTDIKKARRELSKIVGRDTETMDEENITRAAIESVSESTNDGIVAPLFYLILGGPVLAIAYKSISTLDSMVGYKNEKYVNFGWFSARLDDIFNFIPARITGFLICVSSFLLNRNFKNSFRIMLRDGRKHLSPNSGIPEAAMAGALGIKFGGPAAYGGEILEKPFLGDEKEKTDPVMIKKALNISLAVSLLMILAGILT